MCLKTCQKYAEKNVMKYDLKEAIKCATNVQYNMP